MTTVTKELRKIVKDMNSKMKEMTEKQWNKRKEPGKWSKKEILGHLVDSAHNNIRRFIVTQYQLDVPHIIYDGEKWVALQHYADYPVKELVRLWILLNNHLIRILENMPEKNYEKICNTGMIFTEQRTLTVIAEDYITHLKHHLAKIISR